MGVIREYGYREYSDDLTPGKGGESNLLFNPEGELTTHADFHRTDAHEEEGGSRDSASPISSDLRSAAVGAVVLVIGFAVVKVSKRALTAIRARRRTEPETHEAEDQSAAVPAEAERDEQDALIEEVTSLCAEGPATTQEAPTRPAAANTALESHEAERTEARPRRRLSGA